MPANVPNIAPVLTPTAKPIMAPNLILSKQLAPRACLCCTGGMSVSSLPLLAGSSAGLALRGALSLGNGSTTRGVGVL